jgi:hypothetical protein
MKVPLIISSPPYGGTYDYASHHQRRHAWLGMSAKGLRKDEIGARRDVGRAGRTSGRKWELQVRTMLSAMAELLRPEGLIVLLVGDGEVGGKRVFADVQLERLAPEVELEVSAVASQSRPDFHQGRPRREHLVLLRRPF